MTELAENGRSLFDLTRVLPGVVYTGGLGGIQANGNRSNQNNFTLDGVTNVDTGSNGGTLATTNIDMIAEMKVITNSQPAEFGRVVRRADRSRDQERHQGLPRHGLLLPPP